jgi:DNA-binding XRE family transcriptional regulator
VRPPANKHKLTEETRERVRVLSCYATQETIAKLIGIDKKTLAKYYAKELEQGKAEIDSIAVGTLVKLIRAGDRTACIYWTKAQMGWKEKQEMALTDPDGKPLQAAVVYLPDNGRGDRP